MINALYSPSEFPWARYYFAQKPIEPGGAGLADIPVNATDTWNAKCTIDDFHRVATALRSGSDMVLYTHGDADRDIGVSMWVANGYKILMTLDVVNALCELTPKQFEKRYKFPSVLVDLMLKKIAEIQACQLNHVAFRSCNIGKRPDFLSAFAKLFNIRNVSAPKMRDFFARDGVRQLITDEMKEMDDKLTPKVLGAFTKSTRDKSKQSDAKYRTFTMGSDVVKVLILPRTYSTFQFDMLASSARAVESFYRQNYLFRSPIKFSSSDFFQAGLGNAGILNPFAKVVPMFGLSEFGGAERFVLPNEPRYRNQIQSVRNEHFIGDLPMYSAPPPDPDEPIGTLRDRMKRRLRGVFKKH